MNNKMISVIMAYFSKVKYVERSIESVLQQTYKNFELILVYDDETKKDLEFIQLLVKKDKRIKIVINDKNIGAGDSRNKGINLSKGKYIAFIDSDDLWEKNKLEKQMKFMLENNLKISHTSYKIIDNEDNEIGFRRSKSILNFKDLLKSCDIGLSTVLMEKNLIDENFKFSNTKTKEDYVLWLKISRSGINICSIDEQLTSWRKLKNSLSSSTRQKIIDGFNVYYKFMKFSFLKSVFCLIRLSVYSLMR